MTKSIEEIQKEIIADFDAGKEDKTLSREELKLLRSQNQKRGKERHQAILCILDKKGFTSIKNGLLPELRKHFDYIPYNGLIRTLHTLKSKNLLDKNYKPINDNWDETIF